MKLPQFKQTNLVAVLDRADTILTALHELTNNHTGLERAHAALVAACEPGDDWERASLALVGVELMERRMRYEDPTVESFPANWNGGLPK